MFPLSKLLSHLIRVGTLTVVDAKGGAHVFAGSAPGPTVNMRLSDARLYRSLCPAPQSGPVICGFSSIVSGTGGRIPSA